eukprot:NODE_4040_length_873_cov_49.072816_g3726_i0.p2 GENE.NODE_4040_length_873_cov_49.072816_g3726_i0~~NODE_4040_length_873_cov_49.072816_g3726_i0.p2  ORF type:complete len:112 (+),score=24.30 NODE_4040_length_873_cov_49.072816_g3726_i0:101-436(+)
MSHSGKDTKDTSEKERNTIDRKASVNISDMPEDLQVKAIEYTNAALDRWKEGLMNQEREVAKHVKQEFEKLQGPTWHCVFGRDFAGHVTFESKCFVNFTIGQHHVLLWKHT